MLVIENEDDVDNKIMKMKNTFTSELKHLKEQYLKNMTILAELRMKHESYVIVIVLRFHLFIKLQCLNIIKTIV